MAKEIELKILEINPKEIESKLLKAGAKKLGEKLIVEKLFDFENKEISKKGEFLRVRKFGEKTELTYKCKRAKDKNFRIQEEIETKVEDFEELERIFEKLNLKLINHREKKRTSFVLGKLKIEIDKYPEIPAYLELEGPKEEITKGLKLLGFKIEQTSALTSTMVLTKYKANPYIQKF
ncbi:MAG: class IV adenylate cyclase [archaeon]